MTDKEPQIHVSQESEAAHLERMLSYFKPQAQERLMGAVRLFKGTWIGPPDFFELRLDSLADRLKKRPVPLDKYREPILFFVQNLSGHRDPTIELTKDVNGALSWSPSTFVPDADVVTASELLWLFLNEWKHYQDLGTTGTRNFGADDPFAGEFESALQLCAENVAALVRELVNRFPPAEIYSKGEYARQLEQVVSLMPPTELDGK